MKKKVGIPRALLYYNYFPLWEAFFQALGVEVVLSAKTTKNILNQGVQEAVDEACLPVKLFYGHVVDLKQKNVDYIFVPRIVSVEKKAFICPKFLGLPDMIKNHFNDLPPIIDVCVNLNKNERNIYEAVYKVGSLFSKNPLLIYQAFLKGLKAWHKFTALNLQGNLPHESLEVMQGALPKQKAEANLKVALIGHGYNIYDAYISMNIIEKLRSMGVMVITAENLPMEIVEKEADKLPKKMFWTMGKQMIGSAYYYLQDKTVDGIIHIAAFGCGPDSFTGELIERVAHRGKQIPFMALTIDEHTGEAGIVTRLEAFLDMIRWRSSAHESNISTHG